MWNKGNIDDYTVKGFGYEWNKFDQRPLQEDELQYIFSRYFTIFPWNLLGKNSEGFDLGCGSGRWAKLVADRVGILHCIDASPEALEVAMKNLADKRNCRFYKASVNDIPLEDNSMDFGYSLGVLHHVPDTLQGITSCVRKLKPGAPFLIYLYYALECRPAWYRFFWRASNVGRRIISRMPLPIRYCLSQVIAFFLYFPISRFEVILEKMKFNVDMLPLSFYRKLSFYTMRTDAFDRFSTRIEKRFTAKEIEVMLKMAGLENIVFNKSFPYWCAVGIKQA